MGRLTRHPETSCGSIVGIDAEAVRQGRCLTLGFKAVGAIDDLLIPSRGPSVRTGELWRHTCFEAFVRDAKGEGYVELNLSPSTQWAAYRFDGYRKGMAPAEIAPGRVDVSAKRDVLTLSTSIDLTGSRLHPEGPWQVGLSAVIEDRAGSISYWALAHSPGKPDFHHPDCFALELPAPEAG
jgi:hypothetical protein